MLYKNRQKFSKLSTKIGTLFSKIPLTPNQWTIISLIPAIIAVYFLSQQNFLIAGSLFIIASFLDMVDGAVARVTKTASKFGAYLDTIVDRYVEAIIAFGLLFAALPGFYIPAYAWIFLYLFGGMMTTYAKAASKEKEIIPEGKELKGGILERAERLIILFIGIVAAAFNPLYLTYVIALLAVLTNISALQRIWIAKRFARKTGN